jgi:hypothetical protein
MGWASHYIERLKNGEAVSFRPRGNSMSPKIKSGQLCTVIPMTPQVLVKSGDVVLCKVHGTEYLHLVKAVKDGQLQIGNNKGHINGWVSSTAIYGILDRVED